MRMFSETPVSCLPFSNQPTNRRRSTELKSTVERAGPSGTFVFASYQLVSLKSCGTVTGS